MSYYLPTVVLDDEDDAVDPHDNEVDPGTDVMVNYA